MSGARRTNGRDEKSIQNFLTESKEKRPLKRISVDGRIILEWILGK
jgi:hypothetical protein